MAENIHIDSLLSKKEKFGSLFMQLESLLKGESDLIANLGNISSVLKYSAGYFWIGFYFVKGKELVLGPFQGPLACSRIAYGKGVCGTSWKNKETIIVPDVDLFPGHIACSSESRSEIVVPVIVNGEVRMILDADSDQLNYFDEEDKAFLEKLAVLISDLL